MKRSIYLAVTALVLVGLSGCTSYDYYTAAINKTNLSNYHTFAWMPDGNKKMVNGQADAKIKDAATTDLSSKGLQLNQSNPDLVVNYTSIVGRGTRTNYYSPYYGGWGPGWGFGWGWGYRYRPYYYFGGPFAYPGLVTYADQEHYKEGTLIIDLIDTHTHRIVWRGFGVGEVHNNPQKTIDDLPRVVNGILYQLQVSQMPPRPMRQS
jgi:hypothetical protein